MSNGTKEPIIDLLENITGDTTSTQLILDIADKVDFLWFEWAFKVGLVALVFLFFKDFIYNFFYYVRIRYDRYVGIGTLIRIDDKTIGRIKSYDLQYIVIETSYGFIRMPLETWIHSNWTQLKDAAFELTDIRKERELLEVRLIEMEETIRNLKKENESCVHPSTDDTLGILLDAKD